MTDTYHDQSVSDKSFLLPGNPVHAYSYHILVSSEESYNDATKGKADPKLVAIYSPLVSLNILNFQTNDSEIVVVCIISLGYLSY